MGERYISDIALFCKAAGLGVPFSFSTLLPFIVETCPALTCRGERACLFENAKVYYYHPFLDRFYFFELKPSHLFSTLEKHRPVVLILLDGAKPRIEPTSPPLFPLVPLMKQFVVLSPLFLLTGMIVQVIQEIKPNISIFGSMFLTFLDKRFCLRSLPL